ncbi:putative baseplate assembly protein [Paenibacillus montanisoli]|uniref:Putative baseplate assembly protein n=1 Tax=Paenibacillus montanisoli TaxID=2081970 RepID=A0A328U707_9BACL|nr:putative baseplate assembly protein [Paenibacillus montanisoli]RAP78310.1 putative baseplate assembly protein [Paenibacillus montanisoli]
MVLSHLNDCSCGRCEGQHVETPVAIDNPPGMAEIAYRVGTHSTFKQSMLARLSNSQRPELASLTTRSDDDFAIALLDAWAIVADILTFYQERIANESYLRTATERLSLLELARRIGYELRPGVAASVYLAFTIENAPGAPHVTTIPVGTQIQSVPGPGEQAQTFETVAQIQARAAWNAMTPRLTTRHPFMPDGKLRSTFYFAGTATNLKNGDVLIIVPDDDPEDKHAPVFCQITYVSVQHDLKRTQVDIQIVEGSSPAIGSLNPHLGSILIPALQVRASATSNYFGQAHTAQGISAVELNTIALVEGFSMPAIFANFKASQASPPGVLTFRTRAAIFGHNAPRFETLSASLTDEEGPYHGRKNSWVDKVNLNKYPIPEVGGTHGSTDVYLDTTYPSIAPNSYVVLRNGINWGLHQVQETSDMSVADFTLTGKVTKLTLDNNDNFSSFGIRTTTVYAQSEQLTLARLPILNPVSGPVLDIEGLIEGLSIGQGLMICGELDQNRGNHACEYVIIQNVEYHPEDEGFTRVTLASSGLQNAYVRNSVVINGNIAPATHGQSREEPLGSGDGSKIYQKFALRQSPLTYVSVAGPSGAQSTLQVYVNDMLWHEVPALYGHGSKEHIYITRRNNSGITTIEGGDGITGARLTSGQQNVRTVYRTGIGLAGMVRPGQLSLLLTQPAGVKGVTNPMAASGAADPETPDDARQNAPLPVLTLGRVVSLRDYEDFARAFAGVSKALATWTWDGQRRGVFLTIAGAQGTEISTRDAIFSNLLTAIRHAGDPFVPLRVQSYQRRFFTLSAVVTINPDYLPDDVKLAIESKLRDQFSFAARAFGQPVFLSEVVAPIQNVPGVVAVKIKALYRSYPISLDTGGLHQILHASMPQPGAGFKVSAAELLTLDPGPLDLIMTVKL